MDLGDRHAERTRSERERQTSYQSIQSLSHVRVFVTPWTAARQASLSITGAPVTYMHNLKKKWYKGTYLQNRNTVTDLEDELMVTDGAGWEEVYG